MNELFKRIFTSTFLLFILILCILNNIILSVILLLIFYEMFNEFHFLFKRIFKNKKKLLIYLSDLITLLIITYIVSSIWIAFINDVSDSKLIISIIVCICVASDIGGYIFGKLFGGKKITKISPNKTYSGMIGSYFLSIIVVFFFFKTYLTLDLIFFYTILISTISQIGDMFISYLKRLAKVKDTGIILPGHGGLLDRFDGLIFAVPLGLNFL